MTKRPPVWWYVGYVLCLVLVVAGFVATIAGGGVALIALGFPGALGMLGLGFWLRRHQSR